MDQGGISSPVPVPTPSPSPSGPRKSWFIVATVTAVIVIGGSLFLNLQSKPKEEFLKNSPPTASAVPTPIEFSPTQVKELLTQLVTAKDLEIKEDVTGAISGCGLTMTYLGQIKDENRYAHKESHYEKGALGFCNDPDLREDFYETYWIGDKIYNRQYPDDPFYSLDPDSPIIRADEPSDRLKQLFLEGEMTVKSALDEDKTLKIQINQEIVKDGLNYPINWTATVNKETGMITDLTYRMELTGEIILDGKITFLTPTSPIQLPELPNTAYLLSWLTDISNYSPAYYEIYNGIYRIGYTSPFPGRTPDDLWAYFLEDVGSATQNRCYLTQPECQIKLASLKVILSSLGKLLENAQPDFCSDPGKAGDKLRETAKYRFFIKISNDGRNPQNSPDYAVETDIFLTEERKNQYLVRLKVGKESCYQGIAEEDLLNNFTQKLNDFVTSFNY